MHRSSALSLLLVAIACGPPPEVSLSGSAAVTVFAGDSVELPIALQWEGDPRALTVSGVASEGLSVESAQVAPGTTQVVLNLSAAEGAASGSLQITATGEGVEGTLTVPVTVASAEVVSSPTEPVLRGAHAEAVVSVSGGTPTFEGISASEDLGSGQWRVRVPVPPSAAPGEVSLGFTVQVGGATRALQLPATVVNTVTVTVRDRYGAPLAGLQVFVNDLAPVATDAAGQAQFSPVTAPYRLSAARNAANTVANTFVDATLSNPVVQGDDTQLPLQTATLAVRLQRGESGELFTGHDNAAVYVMIEGKPRLGAMSFVAGGNEQTKDVTWRGTETRVRARLRAVVRKESVIIGMADLAITLNGTIAEPQNAIFRLAPPPVGVIHTEMEVPAGYSIDGRSLTAVFAGNRFDEFPLTSSYTPDLVSEIEGALDQGDVGHALSVTASDLAGHTSSRTWTGVVVGDSVQGRLEQPPVLTTPTGNEISDRSQFAWGGPGWPVYRLTTFVGVGDDYRQEIVYTPRQSWVRSPVVAFSSGLGARHQLCGSTFIQSVDDLLRGDRVFERSLVDPGASACDLSRDVTYTGP